MTARARWHEFRGFMGYLLEHPLNRRNRIKAVSRVVAWQLGKRTTRRPRIVKFWNGLRLIAYPDSKASSLVVYTHLPEYHEMLFTLRYLDPEDTVADVGANVGLYSLLASSTLTRGTAGSVEAWVVEANGPGGRYGGGNQAVATFMRSHGYQPFGYDADLNCLEPAGRTAPGGEWNLIFLRDPGEAARRLRRAGIDDYA